MKRFFVLMLAAVLMFSFSAFAGTRNAINYASQNKDMEDFDGIILPAAEEYLEGVPQCHSFHTQDNYYGYKYIDCGREYDGDGNNAVWAQFEQYAEDIVSTGYFEIAHRDDEDATWTLLCLEYTGPDEYLQETFSTQRSLPDDYAIVISSLLGNVIVYYSMDIATSNLRETLQRLEYMPPSGDGDCNACGGDGDCDKCGGSGYIYKTVLQDGKHETIHTRCDGAFCSFGSCISCGGDGDL